MKPNKKYVAPDGLQYAMMPFTTYNGTQGSMQWSHSGCMANDVTNGDASKAPYYAPCDLVCKAVYPSYGQSWWQSVQEVHFANGQKGILNIMNAHDDSQDCYVGQRVSQGSQLANMGCKGIGTGTHCHIQVGVNANVSWGNIKGYFDYNGVTYLCYGFSNEPYDIDDIFFIDDTTMLETLGGNWRKIPTTKVEETKKEQQVTEKSEEQIVEEKNKYEACAKFKGIDVSSHNENVDWTKPDFVIIRATWGTNTDDKFLEHVKKCEEYKIPFGIYCYSYALDDEGAKSEAEYLINLLKDNGVVPGVGIWYDLEDADKYKANNNFDYKNEQSICKVFCDHVKNNGYYVGVYCTKGWQEQYVKTTYPLWIANWGTNDGLCQGDFHDIAVMHQYTSTPLDKNILYVSFDTFVISKEVEKVEVPKEETKEVWDENAVVQIGDIVKSKVMKVEGFSGDSVYLPELGKYFTPSSWLTEYDDSDGKCDQILASKSSNVYLSPVKVVDIDYVNDLVKLEYGYFVKAEPLLVLKK